jgi:hypothetical protein
MDYYHEHWPLSKISSNELHVLKLVAEPTFGVVEQDSEFILESSDAASPRNSSPRQASKAFQ